MRSSVLRIARTSFSLGDRCRESFAQFETSLHRFAVEEPQLYTVMFQIPREVTQLPGTRDPKSTGLFYLVKATEQAVEKVLYRGSAHGRPYSLGQYDHRCLCTSQETIDGTKPGRAVSDRT